MYIYIFFFCKFVYELHKCFNDTNNKIILTNNIFLSSSLEYLKFNYPFLKAFLQNYKQFNINENTLKVEFLSAKQLFQMFQMKAMIYIIFQKY